MRRLRCREKIKAELRRRAWGDEILFNVFVERLCAFIFHKNKKIFTKSNTKRKKYVIITNSVIYQAFSRGEI